jgi:Type II CAAX prenyl endopeptidase Rce1-like
LWGAFFEELCYRWFFFSVLQVEGMTEWNAVVLFFSSCWFSAVHFNTGLTGAVSRWAVGMLLGGLYLFSGSIFPPALVHFLSNLFNYYRLKKYHAHEVAGRRSEGDVGSRSEMREEKLDGGRRRVGGEAKQENAMAAMTEPSKITKNGRPRREGGGVATRRSACSGENKVCSSG